MTHTDRIRELTTDLSRCEAASDVDLGQRVDLLNELAWALSDTEMQRAYALAEEAHTLASGLSRNTPYEAGIARSLRTLGYINQRLGDFPAAVSQLHAAQEMLEALGLNDVLADTFDGLASLYAQTGDYVEGLKFIQRQLDAARNAGDERRVANAHNNFAAIYAQTGQIERAFQTLEENLQRARDLNYERIEFLSCANLSWNFRESGDSANAFEYARRALEVSRRAGFELFEAHAYDMLGGACARLGNFEQGIHYLQLGLGAARHLEGRVTTAMLLNTLAETYAAADQVEEAMAALRECIATAELIDEKSELNQAHLSLSRLYEQQGDLAAALRHLHQHIEIKEALLGEQTHKRLRVLQVTHDVETARQEARIHQFKSRELQREIEEQRKAELALQLARDDLEREVEARTAELSDAVLRLKREVAERERVEAEIQKMVNTLEQRVAVRTDELAALFDLTLLAGQPHALDVILQKSLPRIIEVMRSEAICVHLLDTDNAALRLIAEHGLTAVEREIAVRVALPADIQTWLKESNTPVVITLATDAPPGASAFRLSGYKSYLGAQIRIGGSPHGMLSYFRHADRGFGLDEIALGTALAEQVGIILEMHRLREETEATAVIHERQRLARDLHDSVTQSLYSLSLFSRAGREAAEDGDMARLSRSLEEMERNTLHTLREMRLLLYELRPADLQQEGLVRAIELRLNAVERRANVRVDATMEHLPALPPDVEVNIYYIVEEALNNIVKHTTATNISLQLICAGRDLRLRITDDGQGFDPTQTRPGMGLRNIRERAALLGGLVAVRSRPGGGTRLEVTVPEVLEVSRE
jgi:signal transduction histidine kinase